MDRRFLRPGWLVGHVLVILAVLTCLRLGWWQWDRAHETSGTVQNTGYSLLWPAFGAAFIYMWIRFLNLEKLGEDDESADVDDVELAAPEDQLPATFFDADTSDDRPEIAVGIVGDEEYEDPQLTAYNRALAALAEEDQRRAK